MEARPIRGAVIRGELRSLNGASVVLERPSEGAQTLPTRDLLGLQFVRGDARAPESRSEGNEVRVELEGGDRITGPIAGGAGDQLRITIGGRPIPIKVDAIRKLVFPERVPRGFVESAPPANTDRLYKRNATTPDGEPVLEPVNGTVISFQDTGVEFEGVFGKSVFPWDRIAILIVSPIGDKANPKKAEPPDAIVALVPDGRLRVRLGSVADGALQADSPALGALAIPLRAIRGIRFRGDRFVEVSELDPAEVVEQPYFGGDGAPHFSWRRDRSVTGGPMRVAGSTFDSGLGVHSKCVLHYDVGGKFAAFRAKVGIDDETLDLPRKGSVVFRVAADGKKLWESGIVRSGERAVEVPELDLRGVRRLSLEVDYADGFDIADRADWCEPVLLREAAASAPASSPAKR